MIKLWMPGLLAVSLLAFGVIALAQTQIDPRDNTGEIPTCLQCQCTNPELRASFFDVFLKIDSIEGESVDSTHLKQIDILSYNWGETNTGGSGGFSGFGKVNMQDFHFTMHTNKASPKIMLACANGKHFPQAVLSVRKAGQTEDYMKWKLTDVMCTSYQTGGNGHSDILPTDQFSLNFAKIEFEYKPQKEDGTFDTPVKAGWDLKANKAI